METIDKLTEVSCKGKGKVRREYDLNEIGLLTTGSPYLRSLSVCFTVCRIRKRSSFSSAEHPVNRFCISLSK